MLKAYLVKTEGIKSIYYPGNERTLSLEDSISKVFTNVNDPLRKYLSIVTDLRNTSTHFVTDEYELFYGPILQMCVSYYDKKLSELHGVEISDRIPENYLMLSVRRGDIDFDRITARYDKPVVEKMLNLGSDILTAGANGSLPGVAAKFCSTAMVALELCTITVMRVPTITPSTGTPVTSAINVVNMGFSASGPITPPMVSMPRNRRPKPKSARPPSFVLLCFARVMMMKPTNTMPST